MKKNIKISVIIVLIITLVFTFVNLVSIYCFDKVPFVIKLYG